MTAHYTDPRFVMVDWPVYVEHMVMLAVVLVVARLALGWLARRFWRWYR